jgi:glycerophosphoryl diester phosphodiesterase
MRRFEIVAHRGVPTDVPENTMAGIRRALELGADAVEMDVRLSKDGVPVLFHDFYLDGRTNSSGPVFGYTYDQLQQLEPAGRETADGCRIPTFREVLEAFAGRLGLEIELKGPEPEAPEIVAGELQRFRHLWESMEVTSYEPALLLAIGRLCPGLAVDLLQRRSEDWMRLDVVAYVAVQSGRLAGARAVHLHPTQLSRQVVGAVRSAGMEVHSWDVNDVDRLRLMAELGIPKFDTDDLRLALDFRAGVQS